MIIHALLLQQLDMVAALEHFAFAEDIDDVGVLDRSQTMGHGDGRASFGDSFKGSLDELLAFCLGRLV